MSKGASRGGGGHKVGAGHQGVSKGASRGGGGGGGTQSRGRASRGE